jgi:cell wall-associated NlpC family hydrolase
MADNRDLAALTGNAACDEATYSGDTAVVQLVKPVFVTGSEGSKTIAAMAAGGGVEAGALLVTVASDSTGVLSVDDNGGSLTVDAPVGTPLFVRLSDGAAPITTLPVSQASQPARVATTDTITAKIATDSLHNGTTALTPKFAAISASSNGNNTVVAAVTSKKIRVLAWNLMGAGAVNAKWQSGASGTDLTGLYYVAAAGGGISVPFNPLGWFETASGTLLNLNLSGAVAVGGNLVYVEV